jgi:uncharacterized protein
MRSVRKIALDLIIILVLIVTTGHLYRTYGEEGARYLFGDPIDTIYINDLSIKVSIADSPEERRQGLSNQKSLPDKEGKLFVFDKSDYYGIWMKDMNFPIDIIWIDDERKIVHIEQNVSPNTYPTSYHPPIPARFVLEVNAFFASTFKIKVGDQVTIPDINLPSDLR